MRKALLLAKGEILIYFLRQKINGGGGKGVACHSNFPWDLRVREDLRVGRRRREFHGTVKFINWAKTNRI